MIFSKQRFYFSLIATYFNFNNPSYKVVSKKISRSIIANKKKLNMHFWIPDDTSGARIIVEDIYYDLIHAIPHHSLNWNITVSRDLPIIEVDYLVCFKAIPDKKMLIGNPKLIMLICDQAEIFWDELTNFDALVATSSIAFAKLIARKNKNVFFIGESESLKNIAIGKDNLLIPPSTRPPNLMWHGGKYSLESLHDLRPVLEVFASRHKVNLYIVSGSEKLRYYQWGKLRITHMPWSLSSIINTSRKCRLGIIPSRNGLRTSFLKPASRVRSLYALGLPAIGDQRVPDVLEFMSQFKGPVANNNNEWLNLLEEIWDSKEVDVLAQKGWDLILKEYSSIHTANQWINFFITMEKNEK
jgi:hypothetical protein